MEGDRLQQAFGERWKTLSEKLPPKEDTLLGVTNTFTLNLLFCNQTKYRKNTIKLEYDTEGPILIIVQILKLEVFTRY